MARSVDAIVDNAKVPARLLSPPRAWLACCCYWAVGAVVGAAGGYFAYLQTWRVPDFAHTRGGVGAAVAIYGLAVAGAAFAEWRYRRATTTLGRPHSWAAALAFSLCNGTCESLLMVGAFDAGRALVRACGGRGAGQPAWIVGEAALAAAAGPQSAGGGSLALQFAVGFLCFNAFGGLAHACFWDPYVFPPHLREDVPKAARVAFVRGFVAMGALWTLLYACYGDVCAYIAIHMAHNVASDLAVHMQPPWGGRAEYARYFAALRAAAEPVAAGPMSIDATRSTRLLSQISSEILKV